MTRILATWPGRVVALVLIAALGGGALVASRNSATPPAAETKTATVERASITQTVAVSGSVNASGQARLAFKTGGKLAQVYVTVGQTVQSGTPLAKLDTTDLETALRTAQQNVDTAQASYQKTLLSAEQTRQSLDNARTSAAADIASAQQALGRLQLSYANAKTSFTSFSDSGTAGVKTFQSSIEDLQARVDAIIAEMRMIVGGYDTGDLRNALNAITSANSPPLENARSSSSTLLSPALVDYVAARDAVTKIVADYDALASSGGDTSGMLSSFQLAQTNYSIAMTRLSSAFDTTSGVLGTVQNAVVSAQASLNTQATRDLHTPFDQWRADLASLYTVVTQQQQGVATAKLKLTQAGTYLPTMSDVVGGSIANAQTNVTSAQQRAEQSISNAQNAVDNLPFTLQSSQVSVQNAQNALDTAKANLAAAVLTAPATGTVASIANQVGEYVSGGSTNSAFIVLTNTNALTLHATVGESEIATLKIGLVATVTVDALQGAKMTGKVTSLDPVATISQGVPVYGIDIAIDVPVDGVKAGMSATANVILASKQNVLIVPNGAVRTVGGRRVVQVLKDGETVDTAATFGLSNDTVTEVVSGLNEGDVVVIPQARASSSTANPNQRGNFGGGAGPGGGIRVP